MNCLRTQRAAWLATVAAGLIAGSTSWGAEFWLRTGITTNTMPDGRQVVMWGLARDTGDGTGDGVITVPGPALNVAEGDGLIIHLQNTLPEPVSIVVPGQYNYQSLAPVFHSGDAYDGRMRSLTQEAAPLGGKSTYVWTSVQAGTFLYHSGSHLSVQIQMGLYGELNVVAAGPAVYAGVSFNTSVSLLLSEIDADVHDAVANGTFGVGPSFLAADFTNAASFVALITGSTNPVAQFIANGLSSNAATDPAALAADLNVLIGGSSIYTPTLFPDAILSQPTLDALLSAPEVNYPLTGIPYNGYMVRMNRLLLQDGLAAAGIILPPVNTMTSTIRSRPQYFLVNGLPYTNGAPAIYAGAVGSDILLRILNAGSDMYDPTLNNGGDLKLIAEDGQRAPYPRSSATVMLPALKTVDAGWKPTVAGTNALYDRRLGVVNGLQSPGGMIVYLAVSASNVVGAAPSVLVPPNNDMAFIGQSSAFSVIASHVGTLTYQWLFNGGPIGGATASSYSIASVAATNHGLYSVIVTDGSRSTTSTAAMLTVITQPTPVTVLDGASATFSVTNLGPASATFQWLKDGVSIPGATNSSYTFTANYNTDNGHSYAVMANGPGGPATSAGALLTVTPAGPVIVTQPTNTTVPDFTTASFSVGATGSGLTYQWYRRTPPSLTIVTIGGATSSNYSFTVNYSADNGANFRVVVGGPAGVSVTSGVATLTVTPVGPQILQQPSNTVANWGQATNLTVVAQATGALGYQWQKQSGAVWSNVANSGGISGSTSAVLLFNGTATVNAANSGNYRVVVSSTGLGAGSVTSTVASLLVAPLGPVITAQPVSVVTTGGTHRVVTFSVTAVGFPTPTYRWQRFIGTAWSNLTNSAGTTALYTGVTTPTLTVAAGSAVTTTVAHAGSYRVVLSNVGGTVTSTVASLTVIQTFTGAAVSVIPASAGGTALPYPAVSQIVPAFVGGSVKHVTLNMTLTHPEPYDIQAVLATPTPGVRRVEFMASLGPYQAPFETPPPGGLYSYGVTNMALTFDDDAAQYVSGIYPIYAGTFKPTVLAPVTNLPAPAPGLPYATNFVGFKDFVQTTTARWNLFVNDVLQDIPVTGPNGRISPWSLTLTVGPAPMPPAFVQANATTLSTLTNVIAAAFTSAEAAGDLNVVVVGWRDASQTIQSVTDDRGNTYHLAIGPTTSAAGLLRQSIYYATNIVGGATTVTVTFNGAATRPDVRIVEYANVTALDSAAGSFGTGGTANSGSAAASGEGELVFGADTVTTSTTAPGAGFTTRVTSGQPNNCIAEDRDVFAPGNYSATAAVNGTVLTRRWVMQVAIFKP